VTPNPRPRNREDRDGPMEANASLAPIGVMVDDPRAQGAEALWRGCAAACARNHYTVTELTGYRRLRRAGVRPPVAFRSKLGYTAEVPVPLDEWAFARWDSAAATWPAAPGTPGILVGRSSVKLPLRLAVEL
jgi:hypothetical protein